MYCIFKEFKRHEILSDAAELSTKNKNAKENLNKYLNQVSVLVKTFYCINGFQTRLRLREFEAINKYDSCRRVKDTLTLSERTEIHAFETSKN